MLMAVLLLTMLLLMLLLLMLLLHMLLLLMLLLLMLLLLLRMLLMLLHQLRLSPPPSSMAPHRSTIAQSWALHLHIFTTKKTKKVKTVKNKRTRKTKYTSLPALRQRGTTQRPSLCPGHATRRRQVGPTQGGKQVGERG